MKPIHAQLAALAAGLVICNCAGGPSSSLMGQDLRNAEYRCEWTFPGSIKLENGFYWKRLTPRSPLELRVEMVGYALGELNEDEAYDAAVLLLLSPGRRRTTYWYLAAMLNQDGRARNVATVKLGDRIEVRDVIVRNHQILVEVLPLRERTRTESMREEEVWAYELRDEELVRLQ